MRLKFLSIIISFLIVSIAISSCLDSDNNYEFSTDATIHAFELDTIYGESYKFEIDQIQRLIYNRDSLPMSADTIIDSIKITTLTTMSGVVMSGTPDTLLDIENYQNLLPAMNASPGMTFRVMASDGITKREYHLIINVHKEDPDSLVWHKMDSAPALTSTEQGLKSIVLNNTLFVYNASNAGYKTSIVPSEYNWQSITPNLPADVKLSTLTNFLENLWVNTESGDVYSSANGIDWQKQESLSGHVVSLLTSFPANEISATPALLNAILKNETDGKNYFYTTDGTAWEQHEEVPEGFPIDNYSACTQITSNGLNKAFLVGSMPQADNEQTVPWSSMGGHGWADLSTSTASHCPSLATPHIIYYDDALYIMGDKLEAFYKSATGGIAWEKTEKKFVFPKEFTSKGTSYTITVDPNNFIWIIWGGSTNEVWRGCLNKLKKY